MRQDDFKPSNSLVMVSISPIKTTAWKINRCLRKDFMSFRPKLLAIEIEITFFCISNNYNNLT